jgi:hypothetical protein
VRGNRYRNSPVKDWEKRKILNDFRSGISLTVICRNGHYGKLTVRAILDAEGLRQGTSVEEWESQTSPFLVEG